MPFGEVFSLSIRLLKDWAWFILPVALFHVGWYIWVMYWELKFAKEQYEDMVFLRVTLPQEILSTPKSMEQVFHNLHGILGYIRPIDRILWRARQPWLSFEMVGMNGNLYFIIGMMKKHRSTVEIALFSEYPDIEIDEVADYTLAIPLDIPNKEWTMYGYDWALTEEDLWRIKIYKDWEIEKESEPLRNIDPLAQWAELCTSSKPGEYIWFQLILSPVPGAAWEDKIIKVRRGFDKPQAPQPSGPEQAFQGVGDFFNLLVGNPLSSEKEERPQQRFPTTLDKLIIEALGSKIERPNFEVNIRTLYVAPRDIYDGGRRRAMRGFFKPFADYTNNAFRSQEKTETRIRQFLPIFPETRIDIKRRRALWYYRMRYLRQEQTEWGIYGLPKMCLMYRLNAQELATIYHFPGREVPAPGLRRLPFRKAKAPVELPTI